MTPSDQVAKFTGTQDVTVRVPRDLAGGKYRQTISLRKVSGKLPASVEVWKSVTRHCSRPG